MFGTDLVVLNSYEAATDLLDKRGIIYSDRPVLTMLGELYVPSTLLSAEVGQMLCLEPVFIGPLLS